MSSTPLPLPLPFRYAAPQGMCQSVVAALKRVMDPGLALSIVDVGRVHGAIATPDTARVGLTMTSAACPVADMIIEEVEHELDRVLRRGVRHRRRVVIECAVAVELRWACAAPMALLGWFAFPALTIAAERLEMTRLISRHPRALGFLFATLTGSAIAWRSQHRRASPTDPTP